MTTAAQRETEKERWMLKCANCGHPRGFHGKRDGYADKCVGVYRQPPCLCVAFVEPADAETVA